MLCGLLNARAGSPRCVEWRRLAVIATDTGNQGYGFEEPAAARPPASVAKMRCDQIEHARDEDGVVDHMCDDGWPQAAFCHDVDAGPEHPK